MFGRGILRGREGEEDCLGVLSNQGNGLESFQNLQYPPPAQLWFEAK